MLIKSFFLLVFFATMVGVGVYSRKHVGSVSGFVLGGRSVGPWLTAFAYGTSYFSAVVFVGYAGQFGWKYGMASTWIGIGNALIGSLLAWVVLGRRTRVMSQWLSAATMPQFFGQRFGCKRLRTVSAAIVFVFLVPYTASIYNGLSRLFGMAFHIPYEACVVAMALFTGIYVVMGGYMATVINDFIQGIVMLAGIIAVIWAVLNGHGGFMEAVKSLAMLESDVPATMGQPGAFASFFGTDPANLLGVVVLTSLGTWGLPQMVQKFYAIKNEKAINTGTVVSTFFAVVVAGGCYFLGGFGRLFDNPGLYNAKGIVYDSIIPYMMSTLPDILMGVVVVLVLSASMSTLSSLVLTSSSTLALDFLYGNLLKKASEKRQVLTMQVLVAFFILVSVAMALRPPVFIAQLMGISWGALAGSFLAPFLYGLYWKGVTRAAVWASFMAGVGITVSNMYLKFIASPINAGAAAMVAGLVVVPLVSLFTPKLKKDMVDGMFACYDEEVVIKKKRSLQE